MDGVTLWRRRFREWLREFFRYGRFIFNDHLMVILILAIGAGTYYYQDLLQLLPQVFPGKLFFALLYGWLLITGQVTTFLKAPDTVFLTSLFFTSVFLSICYPGFHHHLHQFAFSTSLFGNSSGARIFTIFISELAIEAHQLMDSLANVL